MSQPPSATAAQRDPLPGRGALALVAVLAAFGGSLGIATLEIAAALLGPSATQAPVVERIALALMAWASLAPPALLIGSLLGMLLLLFPRSATPAHALGAVTRWFAGGPERDPALGTARVLAGTGAATTALVVTFGALVRLLSDETTAPAAPTLAALGVVAGVVPALGLYRACATPLRAGALALRRRSGVARWLLRPGVALCGLGSLALIGAGFGLRRYWEVVLALDLAPLARGLTFPAAAALTARWLLGAPGRLRWAALRALPVLGLLLVGSVRLGIYRMNAHEQAKVALLQGTVLAQRSVRVGQWLLDGDGDGHASVLGGADCDDDNPAVHPGARELPANGVDDDCWGGDAPAPPPPPEPPPPEDLAPWLPAAPGRSGRWNVVLITLDTVRWDHTGVAGYERDTTPNLVRLAKQATVFRRAWSQAPQTKSSMPSMLSGRYGSELYRSSDLWLVMYPDNHTFPELLQAGGYRTAGVLSHNFFRQRFGLSQGFEHWDLGFVRRQAKSRFAIPSAEEVTDRGIRYLAESERDQRPFFLWLHYIDPHHPYFRHKSPPELDFGPRAIDRYDSEIRYTDLQMGRFLDWLGASSWSDNTVVIVHSDHGEGFQEHGYDYHGMALYEDQIRVPLVVHVPGVEARVVEHAVGVIDIAPTVLDVARLSPGVLLQGRSLLPLVLGEEPPAERPIFAEILKDSRHAPKKVMILWPWKLEYAVSHDYYRLYHLERDPGERTDLLRAEAAIATSLQRRLRHWMSVELHSVKAGTRAPAVAVSEGQ